MVSVGSDSRRKEVYKPQFTTWGNVDPRSAVPGISIKVLGYK